MQKIKLSIVIVFFKNGQELLGCLSSIRNSKINCRYEIVVVNNSQKKIRLKGIKCINSLSNLGYSRGNNLGVENTKGEYIFILNPDTKVLSDSINVLTNFLDTNKKAGIVAPNLVDKDGSIFSQMGSRELTPLRGIVALSFINKIFPRNPISTKYWAYDLPTNTLRELDAVPGSAFMIRRNIFNKLGGFDENMFLFFEESDLGRRVKKKGYKIFINPEAEVIHYWDKNPKLKKYFESSRFYYFKKHFGLPYALLVEAFARFGKKQALFLIILILLLIILL